MQEVFHKITSITMALLLLLSTVSWKMEKHYCMGRLMDIALFTDVEGCGMDMSTADGNLAETKNSCCDDEVVFVEGQDHLKLSFNDLDFGQQSFLIALTHYHLIGLHDLKEQPVPHEHYPPPILIKDIQLLDEAFLI